MLHALETAKEFVRDEFSDCEAAFFAGSASRGEETLTSDLDIVIMHRERYYRESFIRLGWRIEVFVNNPDSFIKQLEIDRNNGRPSLASMIIEGKILIDNGIAQDLKIQAQKFLQLGPTPLVEDFVRASRYFNFDLLDDWVDAKNEEEALITLNSLSLNVADFILRINHQWSGRGKTLARALMKYNKQVYDDYFHALQSYYKFGVKQPFIDFVHETYKPYGGQLFDGFSKGKDS